MRDERSVPGYEYHYGFSIDDELVSMYHCKPVPGSTTVLVETRTTFLIKKTDGDDLIIDSEKFVSRLTHDGRDGVMMGYMFYTVSYRLEDYWMTRAEIVSLQLATVDFVKQTGRMAGPGDPAPIVPIVIDMEVRTVQQDGESLEAAMERAVKAENMFPVSLMPWLFKGDVEPYRRDDDLIIFLRLLERKRVGDIDRGLAMMEACRICSRGPTIGAQVTKLPSCGHAHHTRCIVQWLLEGNELCPSCDSIAFDPSYILAK